MMEPEEKSSLGIDVDLACVLCYVAGPLSGGLMLLLEKRDLLIRFHAVQSCLLFAPSTVFVPLFFLLPVPDSPVFMFLYYMVGGGLVIATLFLFIWVVPAAWRMERKRLPIVGRMSDRWIPDDGRAEAYNITGEGKVGAAKADLSQLTFDAVPPSHRPDLFIALIPAGITLKDDLLNRAAGALKFPGAFGGTWDALDACLADLAWIPEPQVVIFHPDLPLPAHPADAKTYVSCLGDAVADWKTKGRDVKAVFPPAAKAAIERLFEFHPHPSPRE